MFNAEYKIKSLPNFSFGLNSLQKPAEILDQELSDCENWAIDETAMITSPGYVRYDSTDDGSLPGPFWGIFQFVKSDGTQQLIRQRQGVLEYDTDGVGTWATCTLPTAGSPAATVTLTQTPATFASLNNTVLFGNGVDATMSSTDGITWIIPTTGSPAAPLPVAKVINNGANRILFFKQADNAFRIDWCDINDPTTINPSSYQLIDPNNGWGIVGIGKTPQGTNLVFTEGAVYTISDYLTDGAVDVNLIADNVRCSSHESIVTTEDSVIFHAYDGIYELYGGGIRKISGRITPTGRNYITKLKYVCAGYINGVVYMSTPDADVSQDYNSQEFMIFKRLARPDPTQPYAIMRNRRYFGCYGYEYYKDVDEVFLSLYAGDSRPATSGSPAVTNDNFSFINAFRDAESNIGLNGAVQDAYFVTKYYTNNVPYYIQLFKKVFLQLDLQNDVALTVSYRFIPYGAWTSISDSLTSSSELLIDYGDGSSGTFSEGYGFALEELANQFYDLEDEGAHRGIQFKIETSQVNDVTIYSMGYKFLEKRSFR